MTDTFSEMKMRRRSSASLTVQIERGRTRDRSSRVRGNTRVLPLVTGEDSGYVQKISVTIMRHRDDVRLCQFSVTTEPGNLQIWTQCV